MELEVIAENGWGKKMVLIWMSLCNGAFGLEVMTEDGWGKKDGVGMDESVKWRLRTGGYD